MPPDGNAPSFDPEIEALFHQALEYSPTDREKFLSEIARRSPHIATTVRSLIEALQRGSGFLDHPPLLMHAAGATETLGPGSRVGRYTVVRELGRGGMGLVYLATDGQLERGVALKVLPYRPAADAGGSAQLRREARTLASLNHPNIATVFTLEEEDGRFFITMEWVPGMNLSEMLERGLLPLHQVTAIAGQIASGLCAAHARGIIHRDLKPSNIRITHDGVAKILDFGLARSVVPGPDGSESRNPESLHGLAGRPDHAVAGVSAVHHHIAGTPGYMSPEQLHGAVADARTDIFSFGCVMYEMITGRRAFPGDTVQEVVRRTLAAEPDWTELPPATPRIIITLLHAMLQRDARRRPADMREVLQQMETAPAAAAAAAPPASLGRWSVRLQGRRRGILIAALSVCAAVVIVVANLPRPPGRELPLVDSFPLNFNCRSVALSPDGSKVIYVGQDAGGDGQLFVRSARGGAFQPLAGTRGAGDPAFAPDGDWVAFLAGGRLQKIPVAGGVPVPICASTGFGVGICWGRDGRIVFAPGPSSGLFRVSADGGTPEPFTSLDEQSGEVSHRWPCWIPGSDAVVFTIKTASMESFDDARIGLAPGNGGPHRVLLLDASGAFHAGRGHLVFGRGGSLFAVPFDEEGLRVTGAPRLALEGVRTDPLTGCVHAGVSANGSLLYVPGGPLWESSRPVHITRDGHVTPFAVRTAPWADPRISPSGRQVLFTRFGANDRIWLADATTGTCRRITSGPGNDQRAIWAPDETTIAFESDRGGLHGLYSMKLTEPGEAAPLVVGSDIVTSTSWSADGRWIVYTRQSSENGTDIWARSGDGEHVRVRASRSNESEGSVAPEADWIAYESNESGRSEVYVCRFPSGGGEQMISEEGGHSPIWLRNGREIVFRRGREVFLVAVSTRPTFRIEAPPTRLFEHTSERGYDASPDGSFFLMQTWPDVAVNAPRLLYPLGEPMVGSSARN